MQPSPVQEELSWWRFHKQRNAWVEEQTSSVRGKGEEEEDDDEDCTSLGKIKVLTFNVMYDDWGREHIVNSPLRFEKTLRLIKRSKADFVGLNEVGKQFQQLLLSKRWVRERYFVSDASDAATTLRSPSGNLLLSRFRPCALYALPMSLCSRKAIVGVFNLVMNGKKRTICVCSTHFTAFTWYHRRRQVQMEELRHFIEDSLPFEFDDIFIMGDFNFHKIAEDSIIPKGFVDVWPAVRKDPGYTFDATLNPFLAETWPLGFEYRRMRLDRIIHKSAHQDEEDDDSTGALVPEYMRLLGHHLVFDESEESIMKMIEEEVSGQQESDVARWEEDMALQFEERLRGGQAMGQWTAATWLLHSCLPFVPRLGKALLAALFDQFGINLFRDAHHYLFPSDHFGLVAVFRLRQ